MDIFNEVRKANNTPVAQWDQYAADLAYEYAKDLSKRQVLDQSGGYERRVAWGEKNGQGRSSPFDEVYSTNKKLEWKDERGWHAPYYLKPDNDTVEGNALEFAKFAL